MHTNRCGSVAAMTASRDRKEAAKRLGYALAAKYRALLDANSDDEIAHASLDLGTCFNDNIEFIMWVLKEYGGVDQMPFARQARPMNGLPRTPPILVRNDR